MDILGGLDTIEALDIMEELDMIDRLNMKGSEHGGGFEPEREAAHDGG